MDPVDFPQRNVTMAKDQPRYRPLPAHRTPAGEVISCWRPTPEELADLNAGKPLWLRCYTFNHPLQPVLLGTDNPWE